jgi:hypothetical protein
MTAFHVIHILVGAWLALAPYLGFLETESALVMNNLIVGAVVALYNLYYLAAKGNVDVK